MITTILWIAGGYFAGAVLTAATLSFCTGIHEDDIAPMASFWPLFLLLNCWLVSVAVLDRLVRAIRGRRAP